jgi:ankyrin repeat protein
LLHYVLAACPKSSQPAILHYLLEKGANPNRSSFLQATPVHFACANDNIDALTILATYGGELHKKAISGTPFSMLSEGLRKEYENKGDDHFISIFQKKEVNENTTDAPLTHRQPPRL